MIINVRGKAVPVLTWTGPEGCRTCSFPDLINNWHMKVAMSSALGTGRLSCMYVAMWYPTSTDAEML